MSGQGGRNAIGVGIIGTGVIFETHADALERLGRARVALVAVADLDPNRLRTATERFFCPFAYQDHRELLRRKDVDVVVVSTPPNTHEALVVEALDAGKLVVCEKPLAHTLAAADRIAAVAERHSGRLSVVYQQRYEPEMLRTLWLRDRGELGRLSGGRFVREARWTGEQGAGAGWWGRWGISGGGFVITQFIHHLDQMTVLYGRPIEVRGEMETRRLRIESEDVFRATIRFEQGAEVHCEGDILSERFRIEWQVTGEKAEARFPWSVTNGNGRPRSDLAERALVEFPEPPRPDLTPRSLPQRIVRKGMRLLGALPAPVWRFPNAHEPYWKRVLGAIEQGEPLPIGPAEARSSLDLCIGIYASALLGQPVKLPLGPPCPWYEGIHARDYAERKRASA